MATKTTGDYTTNTIKIGNSTVTIHRPKLTDAEQQKIEKQVCIAMMQMLTSKTKEE